MGKRSTKKANLNTNNESEKALVKVLIQKIDGDDIKIFCVGHEAITESTMKVIEQFGNDLLSLDEVRVNAQIYKKQNIPLFRAILQKDDVLLQTKYNLSDKASMVRAIANIRELIVNDINVYVSGMMNSLL